MHWIANSDNLPSLAIAASDYEITLDNSLPQKQYHSPLEVFSAKLMPTIDSICAKNSSHPKRRFSLIRPST